MSGEPISFFRADPYLGFLPADVRTEVEAWGIEFALNYTLAMTREFIPQHFFDTVRLGCCSGCIHRGRVPFQGLVPPHEASVR